MRNPIGEIVRGKGGPEVVDRIEMLEGVRGILAMWVLTGHLLFFLGMFSVLPQDLTWWMRAVVLIKDGDAPVALFMILSGFVISHLVLTGRETYKVYITRRFLRLFPAFVCCLLLGVLASPMQSAMHDLPWGKEGWTNHQAMLAGQHREYAVQNILAHLTMLHGLVPQSWWPDSTGAFLGVGWSISTEWQFYLIAPFLIWLIGRHWGFTVLALVVILLLPVFQFINFFSAFENESRSLLLFHIQYFFIGMVSYRIWRKCRDYLRARKAPLEMQGLVLCGAVYAFFVPHPSTGIWVFLFACLLQVSLMPPGPEARIVEAVFCSGIARFLGRISYSIYLVHWPICILLLGFTADCQKTGMGWWTFVTLYA